MWANSAEVNPTEFEVGLVLEPTPFHSKVLRQLLRAIGDTVNKSEGAHLIGAGLLPHR